jgi:anti-sigma-K factor RskA
VALWGRGRREDALPRLSRGERKQLRRRAQEDAELAARIQRAQRRLAQATGPLPVIDPRTAPDALAEPAQRSAPAQRSTIVER